MLAVLKCVPAQDYAQLLKSNETLCFTLFVLACVRLPETVCSRNGRGNSCTFISTDRRDRNVEWLPGAIVLLTQEELKKLDANFNSAHTFQELSKTSPEFYYNSGDVLVNFPRSFTKTPPPSIDGSCRLLPVYFSNFDITTMLPVAGTRHKLLR